MKIYLIESISNIQYGESCINSEVFRNKRKAKKECKRLDNKDKDFSHYIIKGMLK